MKEFMYKLEDTLCDKLEEITEGGNISRSDLQDIQMLTGAMANIEKLEKYEHEGYSEASRGRHYVRGHYSYGDENRMRY